MIKDKMALPFHLSMPLFYYLSFILTYSLTTGREEFSTRLSSDLCPASTKNGIDSNKELYLSQQAF